MKDKIIEILNNPVVCETPGCTVRHHNPPTTAADQILNTLIEEVEGLRVDLDNFGNYKITVPANTKLNLHQTILGHNNALDQVINILKGDKHE